MMQKLISTCIKAQSLNRLAPLADLLLRVYLAKVFLLSGLSKIQDWPTTLFLFTEEYHVPLLSPTLAAIFGTAAELILPITLLIGLFTRSSALGLLLVNGMAVVAYFHVLKTIPSALQDHLEWGLMLLVLVAIPTRRWSLDCVLLRSQKSSIL
ncbi:DoxX family protein [Deefgea salmonis]|uniref:DoxX family protein n=1 Tax=Deefgea salmonis TaxID=2875502 RepID=A0ABS8BJC3_9NEIS|nr:DoxX family protein [Deefgea salmonis]MCB5195828.1 DoxX family protein [Deefgea salmonis]